MQPPIHKLLISYTNQVFLTICLLTQPLVTFPYSHHIINAVDVTIPITVGMLKCFSPICTYFESATHSPGVKHAVTHATSHTQASSFHLPKFHAEEDPQTRPFFFASVIAVAILASSLILTTQSIYQILFRPTNTSPRLACYGALLNPLAVLIYIAMTVSKVLSHSPSYADGDGDSSYCYTINMWILLFLSLANAAWTFMNHKRPFGYQYEIVQDIVV